MKLAPKPPLPASNPTLLPKLQANIESLRATLNQHRKSKHKSDIRTEGLVLYLDWITANSKQSTEESEEEIVRNWDFYADMPLVWTLEYSETAITQLKAATVAIRTAVIERLLGLAYGQISIGGHCKGICYDPILVLQAQVESVFLTLILAENHQSSIHLLDSQSEKYGKTVSQYVSNHYHCPVSMTNFDIYRFYSQVAVLSDGRIAPQPYVADPPQPEFSRPEPISDMFSIENFLSDSKATHGFAEFLKRMSTLNTALSEVELDLIAHTGNLLTVGRSGTGKTTCVILRMFATDMTYKFRSKMAAAKESQVKFTFDSEDVERSCDLHQIFVSASAPLTVLVKDSINSLKEKVKMELQLRSRSKTPQKTEINQGKESKPTTSLKHLQDSDFPAFFTFESVLKAIDSTLPNPFFARNSDGNPIKSFSSAARHQQLDGAYYIQGQNCTSMKSSEVTYRFFAAHFWKKHQRKCPHFDCTQLWFEISAVIKGSATSFTFTDFHLPKELYLSQGNKNTLLTTADKEVAWELFLAYNRWKETLHVYDCQDVVNYLLANISKNGYRGTPVHSIKIDEVQDLTPSMLLLLWKITEFEVFLAGDTAQTIGKGVGFRFKDLTNIFHYGDAGSLGLPTMKQLTVNYRNHQSVLDLANSVISAIEMLFPSQIDRLEHESSPRTGPKPLVLRGVDSEYLQSIIDHLLSFGKNHDFVVLVRDESVKKSIGKLLKNTIILTILETKGLEFDNILICNFFSSSSVEENDWKLYSA